MHYFLLSSLVGRQRVFEPSKEKLRIQNIVETLCPQLCQCKAILQEIIWSLTPGRRCKKMTQALAERAVEVTSNFSYFLEGAEETPQLLDNIFQLEQTLRDIYGFVQSETQRNLLLRILFTTNLRVRYFSLDRKLRELPKPFEQKTVKKPLVLCAGSLSTTIQEDHPGVISQQEGALAENFPPNNSSAIHASGSIFHHANNTVVRGGTFYATRNLVVKQVQDYDRTPQGIVEGADVFTPRDVLPKKEIYKGRGYRVYSAHSTSRARAVTVKLYEESCAKDRCLAAASFSQRLMHPNVLHLIGVSPLDSELPFLVFDEGTEWAIESIIASALSKGLKQSLFTGLQTVAGLSSGLDYLRNLLYPFASVGLDHFVVSSSQHGNILISFDPEVLPDESHEQDQRSGASDYGNELDIFHGLCQRTFDAACKAHYEFQKVQRRDLDDLDADHDLDQDRFEEIGADTASGTLPVDTKGQLHAALPTASSMSSESAMSRRPLRKSSPSAHRRELVWKSQNNEAVSLEEIARQFQSSLLTFSTELGFNRRRGRYTTKTAHRCPGYNRIEITLTPDIARSAIISHLTPIPHEICPVCKEIVKDAEIFACICGCDDNEFIPTIKCSTCLEWHHRPCTSISENEDQNFICQRCKVRRKKLLDKEHTEPSTVPGTGIDPSASVPSLRHLPHSLSLNRSEGDTTLYSPTLVQDPSVIDLPSQSDIIILVMGPTGAGKSAFINKAAGIEETEVGHGLESCTHQIQVVRCLNKQQNRQIVFVDTPAFDNTNVSDLDILQVVADWLKLTYEKEIRLSGLLFFHPISYNRMAGSPSKHLKTFHNLCGVEALRNVVLVTTMWDEVDEDVGNNREDELITEHWKTMIELGCRTSRFHNTAESALDIVSQFQDARCTVLLQKELVDLHLELAETSAGRILFSFLVVYIKKVKELLAQIEAKLRQNQHSSNRIALEQDKARTVATLRIANVQRKRYSVPSSVFRRIRH